MVDGQPTGAATVAGAADGDAAASGSPSVRTFLFSDIEGSTRLEQEVGTARYAEVRERHRELLRAAFAARGGLEQGTEGDSFFVVFASAVSAVLAAVDAQRALVAEPWPAGVTLRVRMGLHAGEAAVAGGSLVGLDINRAARVAASASGGQVVVSDSIRGLVGGSLPGGVSLRPLGSHRLKDLREPEILAQVVADGLPDTFPPLRSIDARPNNLPTQLTSFVGRDAELAEAGRLLAANRLVTLTGPGGTGKTRLSLQVAANAAEAYPDGIFFVPLETVREPGLVAGRIMGEIGLVEAARPSLDILRDWLAGRTLLLVLDNLEQVLGVGPILTELLRAAPHLSILATSRAPLHVSGEQEYQVPGLPAPPDLGELSALERARLGSAAGALDPATLSTYEAVRLFIARASAVRPGFQVTNDNAPAVAAITARLHGMPLPIELAAARIKLLSPDAILARLEHQLAILAAGSRDLPERQQTLRGAIAWSYDLLDESGCRLLDRLSVFRGSFDLEAVEAICRSADAGGPDALDGLMALTDQSLVRNLELAGEPRFTLLETIREFAAERLAASGEQPAVEARHASWYLGFAERLAPLLGGEDQGRQLDRLESEHENLRVALARSIDRSDGDTSIRLAFALWRYWQKRGHLSEARRTLDTIAGQPWSRADPRLRARLMEALGGICWWQGDIAAMGPAYGEAVGRWRELGDRLELANALYNVSFTWNLPQSVGDRGTADADPDGLGKAALEEALALYRGLGDERGQANVLWGLGNRAFFRDEGDGGLAMFQDALALFRHVGDATMAAWALHMAGGALVRSGDHVGALASLREALRTFREAGDAAGITLALDDMSQAAVASGDLERAARLFGVARGLVRATGAGLADYNQEWIRALGAPRLQDLLPSDAFERLVAEGSRMPMDEAVAYALGEASR